MKNKYLSPFICCLLLSKLLICQTDLTKDQKFLNSTVQDYNSWLSVQNLDKIFLAKKINISPEKVVLLVGPAKEDALTCDAFRDTWQTLKKDFYRTSGRFLHEYLYKKFLFQFELPADSAELIISCKNSTQYIARIYFSEERIVIDETEPQKMGSGNISIKLDSFKCLNGGKTAILHRGDFQVISSKILNFLNDKYEKKGYWFGDAKIIRHTNYFNTVSIEVSHIKGEVIKSKEYFEFHKIEVKVIQRGDDIVINWEFQGKYGSGILLPPRQEDDYKDMEIKYNKSVKNYENDIFSSMENFLRN